MKIKKVELADADTLLNLSKTTFFHFFAHLNDPANMQAYASVNFTPQKVLNELSNPNSEFYFAVIDDEPVGYLKLNYGDSQSELKDQNTLEVERIYVVENQHGKNVGGSLLNFAIEKATDRQADFIWLGVWEHNDKALGFYKHKGFEVFGNHHFMLGDDKQTDLLMKKMLV